VVRKLLCRRHLYAPQCRRGLRRIDLGVAQSVTLSSGEALALPVASIPEENRLSLPSAPGKPQGKGQRPTQAGAPAPGKDEEISGQPQTGCGAQAHDKAGHDPCPDRGGGLKLKSMTASAAGTARLRAGTVRGKAGLNRRLLAQGHAELRRMLAYKCERSGARLVAVPPAFTSQTLLAVWLLRTGEPQEPSGFPLRRLRVHDPRRSQCANKHLGGRAGRDCAGRLGDYPGRRTANPSEDTTRKRLAPTGIPAKAATTA